MFPGFLTKKVTKAVTILSTGRIRSAQARTINCIGISLLVESQVAAVLWSFGNLFLRKFIPSFLTLVLVPISFGFDMPGAGEHAIIFLSFRPYGMNSLVLHHICLFCWRFLIPSYFMIFGLWKAGQRAYWPKLFFIPSCYRTKEPLLWKILFNNISLKQITDVLKCCGLDLEYDISIKQSTGWLVSGLEKSAYERENHKNRGQSVYKWTKIRIQHTVTES